MRNRISLVLVFVSAAFSPVSAQEKPVKTEGRAVGGAVALVHRGAKPLVECTVSGDGSTTVMYTEGEMLHFFHLPDHFGSDEKAVGKNDRVFPYKILRIALTHGGKRLFGLINPSVLAAITKRPKILHTLRGNAGLADFALHSDGVVLAAGLRGGIVRLWDLKTGKPKRYIQAHNKDIQSIVFTIDGSRMITASADQTIRFFNFPDCLKIGEAALTGPVVEMYAARDGKTLVTFESRAAQVWDMTAFKSGRKFESETGIVQIAVSPQGKQIAIAEIDGVISLYDIEKGKRQFRWDAHPKHTIVCLQYIEPVKGRKMLVSAAAGDDVVYWELAKLGKSLGPKPGKKKPRR